MKPIFPIYITFYEDNTQWKLNNEKEICENLEWFDSEDIDENVLVKDADGQKVCLKVEKLELVSFKLCSCD